MKRKQKYDTGMFYVVGWCPRTASKMEVVAGGERAGGPFSRRNVQEWSRLDQLTGLLEHARVETDHWATSTTNSSHHFGKVRLIELSVASRVN